MKTAAVWTMGNNFFRSNLTKVETIGNVQPFEFLLGIDLHELGELEGGGGVVFYLSHFF